MYICRYSFQFLTNNIAKSDAPRATATATFASSTPTRLLPFSLSSFLHVSLFCLESYLAPFPSKPGPTARTSPSAPSRGARARSARGWLPRTPMVAARIDSSHSVACTALFRGAAAVPFADQMMHVFVDTL